MKVINFQHYRLHDVTFSDEAMARGYRFEMKAKWETLEPSSAFKALPLEGTSVLYQISEPHGSSLMLETDNAIVAIEDHTANNDIIVQVCSSSFEACKEIVAKIKLIILVAPEPTSDEISVRFWYLSPNGPKAVHRNIAAPEWENISLNYANATKQGLVHLMEDFRPTSGGQLILWHGEPGTGKTYALRALCQAWKDWCSVEYILDPETLLGASPGYLASMIMSDNAYDEEMLSVGDNEEEEAPPWKLLIMEDTGELLTHNARERAGQGLSRLLNVVDGFIGQGLRILVLITTNEEFDKLHPAVSREGRCAASIKFDPLSSVEGETFLKSKGVKQNLNKPMNLSDLFALTKGGEMPRDLIGVSTGSIGFRVRDAVV